MSIVKNLESFGDTQIDLIDFDWAKRFYQYLKKENSKNTSAKKIQRINTVLRTHGYGVKIDTPKDKSTKNKLSLSELLKLNEIKLSGMIELVRDTFMLSFFLRGRRIGDVLTLEPKHIQNGRIIKEANKTEKKMDIKIIPQAMEIIKKYEDKSSYYILPIMKIEPIDNNASYTVFSRYKKQIESKTAVINKYLKILAEMCEIDKNITTHVSRHTFAYLADQNGMTGKRIQDMLEHSDLKTTANYIHDLNNSDMLDNAMDDFISKLNL
jgi:integrase